MPDNAVFPYGLVDIESVPDPISIHDTIPLRDGRQATIVDLTIEGISAGFIPSNFAELIWVKLQYPDFSNPEVTMQVNLPYNVLLEAYVMGNLSMAASYTPEVVS